MQQLPYRDITIRWHWPSTAALVARQKHQWWNDVPPLDEIDFQRRSFIPNSGWPLAYDDVARYERRAAELIGCDDGQFTAADLAEYDKGDVSFDKLERWVNETHIVRQNREIKTSDRIMVLLNATVVSIDVETGSPAVKGLEVAREGQRAKFDGARNYILALGGVETARLLLNVQSEHPELFGGSSSALGRYYMGHISGSFADIKFRDPNFAEHFLNIKSRRSFARRRLTLSANMQLQRELPNVAFWPENLPLFDVGHRSGFLSLAYIMLNMPSLRRHLVAEVILKMQAGRDAKLWPHFKNLFMDFEGATGGLAQVIQQRYSYGRQLPRFFVKNRSGIYPLRFHSEQVPDPANRICLINERDWLGARSVKIDFKFGSTELAQVKRALKVIDESLRRFGIGQLIYGENEEVDDLLRRVTPDGLHQIGSTRMSSSPSSGVVNENCRVFEFENLYIGGSSVFPTAGQASPTFPAVALAMRLSDHLARQKLKSTILTQSSQGNCGSRISNDPLSILFVTASYYPAVQYGGPIYTVHSLARALAERGNSVVVYTTNVGDDETRHMSTAYTRVLDGVTVHYFPTIIDRIYLSMLMNDNLRRHIDKFDVVHAQGAFLYPTVAARRAASRAGVPFVFSPRGMLVGALIKKKNFLSVSSMGSGKL